MKKINIILGIILLALLACVFFVKPGQTKQEMMEENVTIVNAIEQEKSMEHPDFIIEEYVPVIPEGVNIALEGKMDASSYEGGFVPKKANDGDTAGGSYWEGKKDTYPNVLTLDLKEEKSFYAVRVCVCPQIIWGRREQTFSIQISNDGENFTQLVAEAVYVFDPKEGNEATIYFNEVKAQYVQLVFTANTGSIGGQVAEFEVYSK